MNPANLEDPQVLIEALTRYVAGDCADEEVARLSAALEHDPAACALFVEIATQAVLLRDLAQTSPEPAVALPLPARRSRVVPWSLALAASLVLAFVVGRQWSPVDSARQLGRIESASTVVRYSHDGRAVELHVGDDFEAGTLTTDLEETAAVRLRDGTLLALGTDTELALSDDGRKRIDLRRGTFTADVVPQPPGRPMMIHTPTAEIEVVGTSFSLAVEPQRTHLDVDEGLVRVRRLADDATVEVPAGREVRVSPDAADPLQLGASTRSSASWRVDFTAGPPPGWDAGEWVPENGSLRAVPTIEGRRNFAVISNNAWRDGDHSLARLFDDSVVRVTLRRHKPATLDVVLSLREADGRSFVGNAFLRNRRDWNELPVGEWRTLEFPLSEFVPMRSDSSLRIDGKAVFKISITTRQEAAGLEVKDIEIVRRP